MDEPRENLSPDEQPTATAPSTPTAPTAPTPPPAAWPSDGLGQSHHVPGNYPPAYGQPQYPPVGQPQYAQPQYAQPQYAQPQYAQPQYAQPQYDFYGSAPYAAPAEAPSPARRRRRVAITSGLVALLAAACVAGIVTTNSSLSLTGTGSATSAILPGSSSSTTGNGSTGNGSTGSGPGGSGTGSSGTGSSGTTGGATSTGTATATQSIGVVDINTTLKYQNAQAAGTGLVLTSNGEILTNNHVIAGATSISVTVVSTGKTYTATVVGTDPTQDIAVIQLSNASGLATAKISTTAKVAVGDAVTAVGNAGGTGGTPSTASGTVTAVGQSITASDDNGSNPENLTGLIESNAPIQPGDSGGPLYNASGEIIGIDTAGSSSSSSPRGYRATSLTEAYSIPITTAISIATQIEQGKASSTIHLGYPAFIGVQISAATSTSGGFGSSTGTATGTGAVVSGVVAGTPAATAGLAAGDTIIAVGSTTITSQTDLSTALATYKPGQSISLTWTDTSGASHTATVKAIAGPAD